MDLYRQISDNELVRLLHQSDRLAYTEIYERFFGILYTFVYKKIKDEEDAKDILQELFTTIWAKRETLEFKGPLASYLYKAVRNRMIDFAAHQDIKSKYFQSLTNFIDKNEILSDHLIREKQLVALIEKEISSLPKKMREVFLLSRKANLSYKEIAEQLDLSEQTVRSHVKHALYILRRRLGFFFYITYILKFF